GCTETPAYAGPREGWPSFVEGDGSRDPSPSLIKVTNPPVNVPVPGSAPGSRPSAPYPHPHRSPSDDRDHPPDHLVHRAAVLERPGLARRERNRDRLVERQRRLDFVLIDDDLGGAGG